MQNPWNLIRTQFFNIHPDDERFVTQHNKKAKNDQQVQRALPPVPYIGNPSTARVLLLGKNAAYTPEAEADMERLPALEAESHHSLTFEAAFPFFYLNPEFESTSGYKWWSDTLGEVLAACHGRGVDAETVLGRLACIQWHPYHSITSFDPDPLFPTQAYGQHLVREAVAANRLFVIQYGTKNERNWRGVVPELPANSIKTKSAQSAKISAGNLPADDFKRLIDTLCAPDDDPAV